MARRFSIAKTMLITGASSGIGKEAAKVFASDGWNVVATMRSPEKEQDLVPSDNLMLTRLDLQNAASIQEAVGQTLKKFGRIDLLVNNAGYGQYGLLEEVTPEKIWHQFETNVFGVIAVTQAMLPLLRDAPAGRVVNISSAGGSLTLNSDPKNPHRSMFGTYSSSKTAINAITLAFASALESTGIKVNAACPGFTATDLNNFQGTRTVQQAAREPVRLALLDANGPTGTFSNEAGPLPW